VASSLLKKIEAQRYSPSNTEMASIRDSIEFLLRVCDFLLGVDEAMLHVAPDDRAKLETTRDQELKRSTRMRRELLERRALAIKHAPKLRAYWTDDVQKRLAAMVTATEELIHRMENRLKQLDARDRSLALLDSLLEGDPEEQRDSWAVLKPALDEDHPSVRRLFPTG
jgi:hypothetical protein